MAESSESGHDDRMGQPVSRLRALAALVSAMVLAAGLAVGPWAAAAADAKLPAWDGGISLYRDGTFTTQQSWLWCTAADVQIMRNIVAHENDHSTSGQRRYFDWMRGRNRYDLPQSAGVDPQGWTAGLRHHVDDRYRLVASSTFDIALRSAVSNLRRTNLPVAVAVSHGNHGWVLTGFTATADPLRTDSFKVTSVRVVGPLFGLQSKNGYDMRPNTKLTLAQFRGFFTPWRYAPKRMIWDGLYVSIQPIPPKAAPAAAASPTPLPASPTAAPTPVPSLTAEPTAAPTPRPSPTLAASPISVAVAMSPGTTATATPAEPTSAVGAGGPVLLLAAVAGLVVIALLGRQVAQSTRRR
jgi:hypothetical protein